MSTFNVTEVLDEATVKVEPEWEIKLRSNAVVSGNRVKIRGLDPNDSNKEAILARLKKLLLERNAEVEFSTPEVVDATDQENAVVSCFLLLRRTNITYYFPEFVHK